MSDIVSRFTEDLYLVTNGDGVVGMLGRAGARAFALLTQRGTASACNCCTCDCTMYCSICGYYVDSCACFGGSCQCVPCN